MPFPRSTSSCCLFLALIVFNAAAASAHRGSRAGVQQFVSDTPGGYEHYHDEGPHGAYDGHEEEPYYKREPYYEEQHSEGPYDSPHGKRIVPICLQRTTTKLLVDFPVVGQNATEDKFRCCTPADEPWTCAHNGSDYGSYRQERRNHEFMGLIADDHAATCRWIQLQDEACPPFALTSTTAEACLVFQLNCTLTHEATKCGCFADRGLYFATKVYGRHVESLRCLAATGATAPSPHQAYVPYLQGAIDAYATREGYKECEGSVEYFTNGEGTSTAVQKPYPELRWSKANQLIVRLVQDK